MLELEQERRRSAPPSKQELEKREKARAVLQHAAALQQEELDDVKAMRQMMEYAKCVAIRDEQVQDKVRAIVRASCTREHGSMTASVCRRSG